MEVRPVCLDAGDAVELGELLEFLGDWLVRDGDSLAASFRGVVGSDGYDVEELRADLSRFAFLLGGNNGELRPAGCRRRACPPSAQRCDANSRPTPRRPGTTSSDRTLQVSP